MREKNTDRLISKDFNILHVDADADADTYADAWGIAIALLH